jgi:hypothetical protein
VTLEPFVTPTHCRKCRAYLPEISAGWRYCTTRCVPVHNGYMEVTQIGDPFADHLHRTCGRCGYEWLTETADAQSD